VGRARAWLRSQTTTLRGKKKKKISQKTQGTVDSNYAKEGEGPGRAIPRKKSGETEKKKKETSIRTSGRQEKQGKNEISGAKGGKKGYFGMHGY